MFTHILNGITSDLEVKAFKILTHRNRPSDKMETLTMEMLNFKCEVYQSIVKFIRDWQKDSGRGRVESSQILSELEQEISSNHDKLYRYRLHHILKSKAAKRRKQSMLMSTNFPEDQEISQLEKSIVMIEKDLGIENENESNQKLAITKIISKSLMLGLDSTPISKIRSNDYSLLSEAGSIDMGLTSKDFSQDLSYSLLKESQQGRSKYWEEEGRATEGEERSTARKIVPVKKKKIVMSKSDAREGLLGNLLEQTYNQCLDKKPL